MDDARADFSHDDTRRAVRQAIVLNEYLLRRAWGVLFIVLAVSMFFSSFGVALLGLARSFGVLGLLAAAMTVSGSALLVILWTFKRVRYAVEITHPEGDLAWARLAGYRLLVPIWAVLNTVAVATITLDSARLPLVILLTHLGVAVYLYSAIRLSFSKEIPGEAIVAVGSLSLSSVASLALLSIGAGPGAYALIWGATFAVWVFAGVFARTRPVPEFEEGLTGLE